jgi:hypothetical protein
MELSLEEEVKNLKKVQVEAEILKKMEDSTFKKLIAIFFLHSLDHYAFICKFTGPNGKVYTDFVRCNWTTYNNKQVGEIIPLTAYKGVKKGDLHLQQYKALWEKN